MKLIVPDLDASELQAIHDVFVSNIPVVNTKISMVLIAGLGSKFKNAIEETLRYPDDKPIQFECLMETDGYIQGSDYGDVTKWVFIGDRTDSPIPELWMNAETYRKLPNPNEITVAIK